MCWLIMMNIHRLALNFIWPNQKDQASYIQTCREKWVRCS